jgi:hypothetical protein
VGEPERPLVRLAARVRGQLRRLADGLTEPAAGAQPVRAWLRPFRQQTAAARVSAPLELRPARVPGPGEPVAARAAGGHEVITTVYPPPGNPQE